MFLDVMKSLCVCVCRSWFGEVYWMIQKDVHPHFKSICTTHDRFDVINNCDVEDLATLLASYMRSLRAHSKLFWFASLSFLPFLSFSIFFQFLLVFLMFLLLISPQLHSRFGFMLMSDVFMVVSLKWLAIEVFN